MASVLADFIRNELLELKISFTFETVMSSIDKVFFLEKAKKKGFRTYLYFVATEDAEININRVQKGGYPVPKDKIISRYTRSLQLLYSAIKNTNRAYIFDNSGDRRILLAEITDGSLLEIQNDTIPMWFKNAVLDYRESNFDNE